MNTNEELIKDARAYLDDGLDDPKALVRALADRLAALTTAQEGDARERLHAKCDCVPALGPAHCHLCSKDAPVAWEDCAAVSDAAGELVEVVLTTADIETLGHLLVQLSPVTQGNSGATIRRLLREINIKEVSK